MLMDIKYIIVDSHMPIIFHPGIEHAVMARGFIAKNAGFVRIQQKDGKLCASTFGESISLKMKPGPHDETLLDSMLNANQW